jgi:hypothetical protein
MPGTLIVIYPDKERHTERWEGKGQPPLEVLQRLVDGYIEPITAIWDNRKRRAYVDEDGIPKNLMPNWTAMRLLPRETPHFIVGPMVIVINDQKGDDGADPVQLPAA